MKITRNPDGVHAPVAPYAHQTEVGAGGRWLVLSGQIGMHPDGSVPDGPAEQVALALENLRLNLVAAGMEVADLVKLTIYLVGEVDAAARREAVSGFLGDHLPCMTLLHVSALAGPALRVEVDAWAHAEN